MLEESLSDTINITGLKKGRSHVPDEFINMILGLSLVPGGRAQITYETLHKGWSMLWLYFLYATHSTSELERGVDMSETEVNHS